MHWRCILLLLALALVRSTETEPVCADTAGLSDDCLAWKNSCLSDHGEITLHEQEDTVREFLETHCARTCRLCSGSGPSDSWFGWWADFGRAAAEYLAAAKEFLDANPIFKTLLEGDAMQLLEMHGFSVEEMKWIFGALNLYAKNKAFDEGGILYKNARLVVRGTTTGSGLEFGVLLQQHSISILDMSHGDGELFTFDAEKQQVTIEKCTYAKTKVLKSVPAFLQVKMCDNEWLIETMASSIANGAGIHQRRLLKKWMKAAEAGALVNASDAEIFNAAFASIFGHYPESVNLLRQSIIAKELRFPQLCGAMLEGSRIKLAAQPESLQHTPVGNGMRQVPGLLEALTAIEDPLPSCFYGSEGDVCHGVIGSASLILGCLFSRTDEMHCPGLLDELSNLVKQPFLTLPQMCPKLDRDSLKPELHVMVEDVAVNLTASAFVVGNVTLSGEVLVSDNNRLRPTRDSCILGWQIRLKRYLKAPFHVFEDLRQLIRNVAIGKAMASQLPKETLEEYALAAGLSAIAQFPGGSPGRYKSVIAFHLGESPQIPCPGLSAQMQSQLLAGNLSAVSLGPLAGDWEESIRVDKTLARVFREETEVLCGLYTCAAAEAVKRPDVDFLRCMPRHCERLCCDQPQKTTPGTGNQTHAAGNATNATGNDNNSNVTTGPHNASNASQQEGQDGPANEEDENWWEEEDEEARFGFFRDEEEFEKSEEERFRRHREEEERQREEERRDRDREGFRRGREEEEYVPTETDKIAAHSLQSTFRISCPATVPRRRNALDEDDQQDLVQKYTEMMKVALVRGAMASEADFFQCLLQHIPLEVCEELLHDGMDGHGMACMALCSMDAEHKSNEAENEDLYLDVLKSLLKRFKPRLSQDLCFNKYSLMAMSLATDNMVAMSELLNFGKNQTFDVNTRMAFNTTLLHWVAFFKQNNFGFQDFGSAPASLIEAMDLKDCFGRSPLMIAVSVGNTGFAQELLEEDAETFEKNSFGETAERLMSDERLRRRYRHISGGGAGAFASRMMDKSARCQKVFARGGCAKAASLSGSKLRRCYHRLTMASHPDKCSPETRARCERKTMEINECYQRYGGRSR